MNEQSLCSNCNVAECFKENPSWCWNEQVCQGVVGKAPCFIIAWLSLYFVTFHHSQKLLLQVFSHTDIFMNRETTQIVHCEPSAHYTV